LPVQIRELEQQKGTINPDKRALITKRWLIVNLTQSRVG